MNKINLKPRLKKKEYTFFSEWVLNSDTNMK